jgi:orotate phosphoribosyltransferase
MVFCWKVIVNPSSDRARLALLELLATHAFERRQVILSSGRESSFYCDCRKVTLHPKGLRLCAELMFELYRSNFPRVSAIGGPTLGADPLVAALILRALEEGEVLEGFIVRKEAKSHGTGRLIEGLTGVGKGAGVLIVEDVLTTGASVLHALRAAQNEGLEVRGAIVLVDRLEGGSEALEKARIPLRSVFTISEIAETHDRLMPPHLS